MEERTLVAQCTRCGRGLPRGAYADDHSQCWIDGEYVGECEYVTLPMSYCDSTECVRKYRDDGSRYVACAACGADVTEPDDVYADRVGAPPRPHVAPMPTDDASTPPTVTVRSFVVELHADYDANPRDFDCYDADQLAAWDRGEWRFVGMVPILSLDVGDCEVEVKGPGLWAVEWGDLPGMDSGMGETSYLVYAARENLYDAHEWLASMGVDIDTLEPYIVERF